MFTNEAEIVWYHACCDIVSKHYKLKWIEKDTNIIEGLRVTSSGQMVGSAIWKHFIKNSLLFCQGLSQY